MHSAALFIICSFLLLLAAASVPVQTLNGYYFNVSCESKLKGEQLCSLDRWKDDHSLGPAFALAEIDQFVFLRSPALRKSKCIGRFWFGLICTYCRNESLNFCRIYSPRGCFLTVCTNVIESCKPRWDSVKNVDYWSSPEVNNKSFFNQKCGDQQVNLVPPKASSSSTPVATTTPHTTSEDLPKISFTSTPAVTTSLETTGRGVWTTRKGSTPTTAPPYVHPSSSTSISIDVAPKALNGYYFNVSCEYKSDARGPCSYETWQGNHNLGAVYGGSRAIFEWHGKQCETFRYGLVCAYCTNTSQNFCHIRSNMGGCFVVVCTNVIEDCVPKWNIAEIVSWPKPERHNKSLVNQKCGDQEVKPVHPKASSTTTPVVITPLATTAKGISTTTEGSTPTASPLPTNPSSASSTATASTPNRNLQSHLLQEIINRQEQQTEILAGIREDIRKLKPVVNIGQVVNNGRTD